MTESPMCTGVHSLLHDLLVTKAGTSRAARRLLTALDEASAGGDERLEEFVLAEARDSSLATPERRLLAARLLACLAGTHLGDGVAAERVVPLVKRLMKDHDVAVWRAAAASAGTLAVFAPMAEFLDVGGFTGYERSFRRRSLTSLGTRAAVDRERAVELARGALAKYRDDPWALASLVAGLPALFAVDPGATLDLLRPIADRQELPVRVDVAAAMAAILGAPPTAGAAPALIDVAALTRAAWGDLPWVVADEPAERDRYGSYRSALVDALSALATLPSRGLASVADDATWALDTLGTLLDEGGDAGDARAREAFALLAAAEGFESAAAAQRLAAAWEGGSSDPYVEVGLARAAETAALASPTDFARRGFAALVHLSEEGNTPLARVVAVEALVRLAAGPHPAAWRDVPPWYESLRGFLADGTLPPERDLKAMVDRLGEAATLQGEATRQAAARLRHGSAGIAEGLWALRILLAPEQLGRPVAVFNRLVQSRSTRPVVTTYCKRQLARIDEARLDGLRTLIGTLRDDLDFWAVEGASELLRSYAEREPQRILSEALPLLPSTPAWRLRSATRTLEECLFQLVKRRPPAESRRFVVETLTRLQRSGFGETVFAELAGMARTYVVADTARAMSGNLDLTCTTGEGTVLEPHVPLALTFLVSDQEGQPQSGVSLEIEQVCEGAPTLAFAPAGDAVTGDDGQLTVTVATGPGEEECWVRASALKGKLEVIVPFEKIGVTVDTPASMSFSEDELAVIKRLYRGFETVIIDKEFGSGFSGSRVLRAIPVTRGGKQAAPKIAKLGPKSEVRGEETSYRQFVADYIPIMAARVERHVEHGDLGGLNYVFMGGGGLGRMVELEEFYAGHSAADLQGVLTRVLRDELGEHWYKQSRPLNCRVLAEYGAFLPESLVLWVRPGTADTVSRSPLAATKEYESMTAAEVAEVYARCLPGSVVEVSELVVTKIEPGKVVAMDAGREKTKVKMKVAEGADVEADLAPGDTIVVRGEVVQNRDNHLRTAVEGAVTGVLGGTVRDGTVEIPGVGSFTDPLARLPKVLDRVLAGRESIIHGDLHLRNIMVDEYANPWLIDFGLTREGHLLFDFIKLETYVRMMELGRSRDAFTFAEYIEAERGLAARLDGAAPHPAPQNAELAKAFAVIATVRDLAADFLLTAGDFGEYRDALFTYSLGLFKYFSADDPWGHALLLGTALVLADDV